jgi:atypical dual specificity phosphatase
MRWLIARLLFYPTLAWNLLLSRVLRVRRWWDRVDEHVLVGALPLASDVPSLQAAGVGAVVNCCEEYKGPVQAYERAGIVQLRLPTIDFVAPTLEDAERGAAFIQERVEQGESVYVHCKAGRGRSATIALCWLIAAKGMTPDQAQAKLLEKRPHVCRSLARRRVVQQFAARRSAKT